MTFLIFKELNLAEVLNSRPNSSSSNWDVIFYFEWLNTKVLLEINKKILIEKIVHWINSSKFNGLVISVDLSRFNRICI